MKFLAKRGRARNGRSDAWPPFVISSNVSLPRENKIIQGFDWFWLRWNKICRHKNDLFSLPFPMGHRLVHSELGGALLIVITSSTTFVMLPTSLWHAKTVYSNANISSLNPKTMTIFQCANLWVFITSTIYVLFSSSVGYGLHWWIIMSERFQPRRRRSRMPKTVLAESCERRAFSVTRIGWNRKSSSS